MKVNFWILISILFSVPLINPNTVAAELPVLTAEFSARNLTTNSEWMNPVSASDQDIVKYRLIISNAEGKSPATSVGVQVIIPNINLRLTSDPISNVVATNGQAKAAYAITSVDGNGNYGLEYVVGSSRVTKAGVVRNINPDTISGNVTTERVQIGEVLAGTANQAIVEFDAKVVTKSNQAKVEPTLTPASSATNSAAVADSTPETGPLDQIWLETGKWLGIGAAGLGLKEIARKATKRINRLNGVR